MEPISYTLREVLVSQGIANGRAGTRANGGMKGRAAASDGAVSRVKASNPEGEVLGYSPIGRQGGAQPMGNSGKDRGNVAPAKFTVLTCEAPNAHGRRKKAPGTYLRLVWSR